MNSLWRCSRQSKFLKKRHSERDCHSEAEGRGISVEISRHFFFNTLFLIGFHWVFFSTSLAYGNNPIRNFVREVMERIVELSRARSSAYSGSWNDCLKEAIQAVREERGTTVSNEVIAKVMNFLRTPESAERYVKLKSQDLELSSKLISDWEAILKVYMNAPPLEVRVHSRLAGYPGFDPAIHASPLEVARSAQLSLSELSESGPRQAILISYYSDEIAKEARELLEVSGLPEFSFLRPALEGIEKFFKKKMAAQEMAKSMINGEIPAIERERLILEDFIEPIVSKLDDGILGGRRGMEVERKLEVEVLDFMGRLKELRRKIFNYGKIIQAPVLASHHSTLLAALDGLQFDLSMATMRYGDIEMKKTILSLWIRDFKQGFENVFNGSVLSDILSQPDNEFRKHALQQFYENFPRLRKMPKRQIVMVLDGLWGETYRYFPGERGFDEAVETMIFLLGNSQEVIPSLLASRGIPLAKKRIALLALQWLETESAFKILSESYFTDFRNDLLPDLLDNTLLLETFFDALIVSVRGYPQHHEAAMKFLKSIIQSETDHVIRKRVIRAAGEISSDEKFLYQFTCKEFLYQLKETDPEIQAELILGFRALSQVPYVDEEGLSLLRVMTERVLQFQSHEDPNLRVAAALFLKRHGDEEKKRVGNQILRQLMAEAELSSKLTDRFKRLILSIIPEDAKIPLKFKNGIVCFIRSEPDDLTVDALLVLCRLDDPAAAREAALKLLQIWDRTSPSGKRRIIHALLQSFPEDTGILKKTLVKVIEFYRDPKYGFDMLDELSAHLSPVERLSKLSKNTAILSDLVADLHWLKSENKENPRLVHFVDELITKIEDILSKQPPLPF